MTEDRAVKILADTIDAMVYALAWDIVKERNPDRILPSHELCQVRSMLMFSVSRHAADVAEAWKVP